MPLQRLGVIAGTLIFLESCSSVGACYHIFKDPVLAITGVTGANSTLLASVTISEVTFGGQAVIDLPALIAAPAYGVDLISNTVLRCQIRCGFGMGEGSYAFTVTAPGYHEKRVSVTARYANFDGGCPSENSGSAQVTVSLEAATP